MYPSFLRRRLQWFSIFIIRGSCVARRPQYSEIEPDSDITFGGERDGIVQPMDVSASSEHAVHRVHAMLSSSSDTQWYPHFNWNFSSTSQPVETEQRSSNAFSRARSAAACWAASCPCGYVFDDVADAYTRWPNGRLCCYACA